MTTTIDVFSGRLVKQILAADNQEEVSHCVESAMETLLAVRTDFEFSKAFIDKMILLLGEYNPMVLTAVQWSNIKMGKLLFNRLERNLASNKTAHS